MSLQFRKDMLLEDQITRHLKQNLFDDIFENYTLINDKKQQKNGVDMKAFYDSSIVNIDIKSQVDYINDPLDTFVLEIFSETNNKGNNNIGWFIDNSLVTDYYLFTRLPKVDLFEYDSPLDIIKYFPVEELGNIPDFIENSNKPYAFKTENIDKFSEYYYPISMNMFKNPYGNSRVFNSNSIKEQDVILLNVERIKNTLKDMGLTRNKLLEDARQVYRTGENKIYNDLDGVKKMHISSRYGESPVNLVAEYKLYDRICDLRMSV